MALSVSVPAPVLVSELAEVLFWMVGFKTNVPLFTLITSSPPATAG